MCTGTATEIGKTWTGATVLAGLRAAGVTVSARKPAQSFDPDDVAPTDRDVLAGATGEDVDAVCPPHRSYPRAFAPPMAAASLGRPGLRLADLVADLAWETPHPEVRWIETAGGVRSPLADDGDTVDLCARVRPDVVVLVADAGLGTINAVTLAATALEHHPTVVFLNRYDRTDELHRRNRQWLVDHLPVELVTDADALALRLRPTLPQHANGA